VSETSRSIFNALRLTLRAQPRSAKFRFKLTTSLPCDNLVAWQNLHWDAASAH
jgi:hypothetical protein